MSSDQSYTVTLVELGSDVDDPTSDTELYPPSEDLASPQPLRPGSYVNIDKPLAADQPLFALTLECWVRPSRLSGSFQGLITQHTYPTACGLGLFITDQGRIAVYLGDGGAFDDAWLVAGAELTVGTWSHLVASWDGADLSLWVDGEDGGQWPVGGTLTPGPAPLRLGAYGNNGVTDQFLDGDLAMPVIYDRALAPDEVAGRYEARALIPPDLDGVLGCWPLDEETGERVADISLERRHGRIINRATWMIGGPSFDSASVPRHGRYDPAEDPRRGHGLRLASDDIYNCGWAISHEFVIPETQKPGIYVARLRFGPGGLQLYDVTFIVRKAPTLAKAPILVLCSSNTWLAYNSTPFPVNQAAGDPRATWGIGGSPNNTPGSPAYSCYRNHAGSQPTHQVGVEMPWPAAGPYVLFSSLEVNYSHLMRAERFLHLWLSDSPSNYDYDVAIQSDLIRDPSLLDGYAVLIINGHSEYWSAEEHQAVDHFLTNGGSVIVLSGNTMLWRVSFDEDFSVMECRKLETIPGGREGTQMGETYHSTDGRRGSLMRECGYPAWNLIGMESAGFTDPNHFLPYTCVRPDHFLFQEPNPISIDAGDTFADGSVGHEWDLRINHPQFGGLPYEQDGIETLAECHGPADTLWNYFPPELAPTAGTPAISQMIYWERPLGGRVFYAGSIAAGWGLTNGDPKWNMLLTNVLDTFLS